MAAEEVGHLVHDHLVEGGLAVVEGPRQTGLQFGLALGRRLDLVDLALVLHEGHAVDEVDVAEGARRTVHCCDQLELEAGREVGG